MSNSRSFQVLLECRGARVLVGIKSCVFICIHLSDPDIEVQSSILCLFELLDHFNMSASCEFTAGECQALKRWVASCNRTGEPGGPRRTGVFLTPYEALQISLNNAVHLRYSPDDPEVRDPLLQALRQRRLTDWLREQPLDLSPVVRETRPHQQTQAKQRNAKARPTKPHHGREYTAYPEHTPEVA